MGSNLFASAFSSYSIFFSSSNDAPVAEGEETNKNSWGKKGKLLQSCGRAAFLPAAPQIQ